MVTLVKLHFLEPVAGRMCDERSSVVGDIAAAVVGCAVGAEAACSRHFDGGREVEGNTERGQPELEEDLMGEEEYNASGLWAKMSLQSTAIARILTSASWWGCLESAR